MFDGGGSHSMPLNELVIKVRLRFERGLDTAVKPLLSHSATGEFKISTKYVPMPKKRPS